MKTLLLAAIEERRLVRLLYEGQARTAEPYALGRNSQGEDIALCREVLPRVAGARSWQIFLLHKICELSILDCRFERPKDYIFVPANVLSGIRLVP